MPEEKKPHRLFAISGEGEKKTWKEVGIGWVNSDGSINVQVHLFPGLHLQLRPSKD
jgi:hypothetical protein